jgi:hypothetical protein
MPMNKRLPGESVGVPDALRAWMPSSVPDHKTADPARADAALRRYQRVVADLRVERRVCECCGGSPQQVNQKKLYAHHLKPVSGIEGGLESPLAVHPSNLLLVCNSCHCLFHTGLRSYPWGRASSNRVKQFRKTFGR